MERDFQRVSASDPLPETRRPRSAGVISCLLLLSGGLLAASYGWTLYRIFSTSEGPVNFSPAYTLNLIGESLLACTAIFGAVGLLFGTKWGWLLAAMYCPWIWSREVILAVRHSSEMVSESNELWTAAAIRGLIFGLVFIFLFRANVLAFVRLSTLNRPWSAFGIVLAGVALPMILDPLHGLFATPDEFYP